jgi:hypothetical protein
MPAFIVFVLLLLSVAGAQAQSPADSASIRDAALDYIEGWYDGDADRMATAVHPDLVKRIVVTDPGNGRNVLQEMSAADLIEATRRGGGRGTPAGRRLKDIRILDVFRETASVRVDATDWIDLMHLARVDGEWKIINVLWTDREAGAP